MKYWLMMLCLSCGAQQLNAADALARAANVAGAEIVREYGSELMACVNEAGTLEESKLCRAGVDAKWTPVQDAWKKLQAVQDNAEQARAAYCALRSVAPMKLLDVNCGPS